MVTWAFLVGTLIIGIAITVGAVIIASAVTSVNKAGTGTEAMDQPPLRFLTEYDAADYLGLSLKELDYMRKNGMLDGTFFPITALEQTGEEEYYDIVDGVEVVKLRPVMTSVTRYTFDRELLDAKMVALIRSGGEVDTSEKRRKRENRENRDRKSQQNRNGGKENKDGRENGGKPGENRDRKPGQGKNGQKRQDKKPADEPSKPVITKSEPAAQSDDDDE